jgi:hypothetical protein
MGNATTSVSDALFKEYESTTGKLLLRGIRNNNKKQVTDAIDFARKELATPNMKKTHEQDFAYMTQKMTAYLTRKYDVEEGILHWKTPLDYAKSLGSELVIEVLENMILQLAQKTNDEKEVNIDKAPSIKAAVGKVDADRVALAKARLQEMRNKK